MKGAFTVYFSIQFNYGYTESMRVASADSYSDLVILGSS
jgi:hypothetical protein